MNLPRLSLANFSVAAFYRSTWQLLILLTCILALMTEVVRPWVGLPAFAVAFFLVTSIGLNLGSRRRLLAVAVGTLLLCLAAEEAVRIQRLEDFIQGMIEMISGALSLLLLRPRLTRTYWLAILNVAIIGVGAISLSSSPLVYALFLLLTGCILLNMNAAHLYFQQDQSLHLHEPLPPGYMTQFLLVMPLGTVSALLIFLAFPRVQSFTMSLSQNLTGHRTGYSGLVNLSGGGELQESQSLAFMVEADDHDWLEANTSSLLFRGDALDTFDGRNWSNSVFSFRNAASTDLRLAKETSRDIHLLTIHLEPSSVPAIFYPEVLLAVTPVQPASLHLLVNGNGSLSRDSYSTDRITYETRTAAELSDADLPTTPIADVRQELDATPHRPESPGSLTGLTPESLRANLEVPAAIRNAPYFTSWLAELHLDPKQVTIAGAQRRLLQIFNSKFTPTLANSFHSQDSLAAFLGEQREGHCEYFATAAALTLRALGVPARVVVGFQGGTFNHLVGGLEVRDDDAHAWVEAYVPGIGWHSFNPTPPVPRASAASFTAMLRLYANATSFWLRRYVVDYDQSTQRSLLQSLRELAPKRDLTAEVKWLWFQNYGRSIGLLVCVGVLFWWLGQLWRSQSQPLQLPRYYRKFLAKQQRAGRPRRVGETFAAYHQRLLGIGVGAGVGVDRGVVEELDRRLERDLYGRPE